MNFAGTRNKIRRVFVGFVMFFEFKEENNRRIALDQKKREEQMQFVVVKKHLKTTKEQRKLKKEFLKERFVLSVKENLKMFPAQ